MHSTVILEQQVATESLKPRSEMPTPSFCRIRLTSDSTLGQLYDWFMSILDKTVPMYGTRLSFETAALSEKIDLLGEGDSDDASSASRVGQASAKGDKLSAQLSS